MSNATSLRLLSRATSSRTPESKRPSPCAIFSTVVSVRRVDVTSSVRSALTMPLCTVRTASSSSEATTRSTQPGTGSSDRIGMRPSSAAKGVG